MLHVMSYSYFRFELIHRCAFVSGALQQTRLDALMQVPAGRCYGREAREIQEEIIKSYVLDFAKHAPATDIPKLTQIWDSIPKHLAREG